MYWNPANLNSKTRRKNLPAGYRKNRFKLSDIVYFDDLGINLKPARNLGVQTVKVLSKNQLIDNLRNIFPEVFESERFI